MKKIYPLIIFIFFILPGQAYTAGQFDFRPRTDIDFTAIIIPNICNFDLPISQTSDTFTLNRHGVPIINDFFLMKDLILSGQAFVYPKDKNINANDILKLLNAEQTARKAKHGCIWQHENIIVQHDEIRQTGRFMIIEGRVFDVHESRNNTYLNFDDDWKTDFTIRIEKSNRAFKDIDLSRYKGKHVRVRGFVEDYYGPSLTLNHPALLETLHTKENHNDENQNN